ncbi:MAG: von Willebrand factor type A domain-containing protein [Candidatus Hydrogenedentes bacterium]|nr:von Willebrand factor type A domain-containing protein [Candidatus Hydrogenedentota bacterium]
MKPNLDIETLTAYALGELEPADADAVKKALETDPEACKTLEELKATADLARTALHAAPQAALTDGQRAIVMEEAESSTPHKVTGSGNIRHVFFGKNARGALLRAAAALVVIGALYWTANDAFLRQTGPELAGNTAPEAPAIPSQTAEPAMAPGTDKLPTISEESEDYIAGEGAASAAPTSSGTAEGDNDENDTWEEDWGAFEVVPSSSSSAAVAVVKEKPLEQPADAPESEQESAAAPEPVVTEVPVETAAAVEPAPAIEAAPARPAPPAPAPAKPRLEGAREKPGGLKSIVVGGQVRVRGSYPPMTPAAPSLDKAEAYLGGGALVDEVRQLDTLDHPDFNNDPNKVYWPGHNTESYDHIVENPFRKVADEALSTFSIDVDTASYANTRRFLNQNTLPPPGAVRIEEFINYFDYHYAPPDGEDPFAVHVEVASCRWKPEHRLARIGLKGKEIPQDARPACNLVFLIDVSSSMSPPNKLPLLKRAMKVLAKQLRDDDRVAIAVYAGSSGLILPSTPGSDTQRILEALNNLESGGSTNGGEGIKLAYNTAIENFLEDGVNRVILATDGDFNVGISDQSKLVDLIENKAKTGVFLSVLGFGMGNLKDSTLEKLADKGNGNYAYIDDMSEARKVLVQDMLDTLVTIAKDVKIQVEFNPAEVQAYRLIGYENRILAKEDFNDDTKDAGEIGAGHTVTALYELVPSGVPFTNPGVDPLKYQQDQPALTDAATSGELFSLKLRYKQPDGEKSKLLTFPVKDEGDAFEDASEDYRFAAAVAAFGMLLRDSEYKGDATYKQVLTLAQDALGADEHKYRAEFLKLVRKAQNLANE